MFSKKEDEHERDELGKEEMVPTKHSRHKSKHKRSLHHRKKKKSKMY